MIERTGKSNSSGENLKEPGFRSFRRDGWRGHRRGLHPAVPLPVERARDFKGTLKKLAGYLRPFKYQILFVFLLAACSTVFSIFSPVIMGKATTKLFEGLMLKLNNVPGAGIDFQYIRQVVLILAALYLLSACFGYAQQYLMAGIAQRIAYNLRKDVVFKLSRLPLKFYDSHAHGEILSRVTNDIDNIGNTLQQSLIQLISAVVSLTGMIIMMLSISPLMTAICLVTIPLCLVGTRVIIARSQRYFKEHWKELGLLNGHVEEMYAGHQIIKAFGHETGSINQFEEINERLYEASWKSQFISGIIMPLMQLLNNAGYVFVCIVGGILVTRRTLEIGDVQAMIHYSKHLTHPITQTANIANIIQSTVASAERVFELLDEDEEVPDSDDAVVIESPKGQVIFHNVKFSYQEGTTLIEDLNIDVKEGQTVAIVGPTGAGKTTLVNLLMRFYEVNGGRITVDGVEIGKLKREALRGIFGMVLQDTWLFNGTVRANIAYGREDATLEEIVRAAQAAHADHFIRALPDGYDTVLNEDASNISQGQKQLLTIARAILADPAILILDEATSSVDTRTEAAIQKAMANLMKGRTSFVIAHRLSTIRDADLILVMDKGRIVEKGKHHELLARGGFYAELYYSQFRDVPAAASCS
ncbi:MAG TPA: ABC transporter ATP-binding protein [Bacillota bacterium]|jgi:ATP-binding cassette subfamily B protein|nr:ABC transporter ATP-binding protein [Peptococcaceae bacterium MAG4]NLW37290.1 ABC transporter ATP-binding protein [Peptococcaceae bacterium]HPU35788.1 ABC transporter ATP-binding protein [Bacillota bacterium]HPZ44082.1 ABC transporter ATP-binding protein [Bacillota bacterium]HQD76596.1 ABC transporter ATP-binding protein [Bacillota bacterium]